jgi:hypothetical protein
MEPGLDGLMAQPATSVGLLVGVTRALEPSHPAPIKVIARIPNPSLNKTALRVRVRSLTVGNTRFWINAWPSTDCSRSNWRNLFACLTLY